MPLRDDFQLPQAVFSSSNGQQRLWGIIFSRKLPSAGRNMPAPRSPVPAIGQRWPNRVIPAKSQTRNALKHPVLLKISRDRPMLAYHPPRRQYISELPFTILPRPPAGPWPPPSLRHAAQPVPAAAPGRPRSGPVPRQIISTCQIHPTPLPL